MSRELPLCVVSDIHYAGEAERARGHPRANLTRNPFLMAFMRTWDRVLWMRDPLAHNHLLDRFIAGASGADMVIANGDFSCDSACIGMWDDAAFASAAECLGKLRSHFGSRFHAT